MDGSVSTGRWTNRGPRRPRPFAEVRRSVLKMFINTACFSINSLCFMSRAYSRKLYFLALATQRRLDITETDTGK